MDQRIINTLNIMMIIVFIAFISFLLVGMIDLWPELDGPFELKDFWFFQGLTYDQTIIILVILSGALGAFIHMAWSFTVRLATDNFNYKWIPWYILRPFIGSCLAFTFYLLIRGGLILPTTYSVQQNTQRTSVPDEIIQLSTQLSKSGQKDAALQVLDFYNQSKILNPNPITPAIDTNQVDTSGTIIKTQPTSDSDTVTNTSSTPRSPINPYGILAISVLAGLYAKQALEKLEEIFNSLFRVDDSNHPKEGTDTNGKTAQADTNTTETETTDTDTNQV